MVKFVKCYLFLTISLDICDEILSETKPKRETMKKNNWFTPRPIRRHLPFNTETKGR